MSRPAAAPTVIIVLCGVLIGAAPALAPATAPATQPDRRLPERTSRYNVGDMPGRYRDANKRIKLFALKSPPAPLYDGGGREIARFSQPVMLNVGAFKQMTVGADTTAGAVAGIRANAGANAGANAKPGWFAWAWRTDAKLSGWVAVNDLVDPPKVEPDAARNVAPPAESKEPLTINASRGLEQLRGLRHVSTDGNIPAGGGNMGEHYASRNPGELDYVYLLFAVPTVQRGGVAKDSIPDGGHFIPALDENGNLITEVLTMYRDGDFNQPVPATFLYGRASNGKLYGWLARANVGER